MVGNKIVNLRIVVCKNVFYYIKSFVKMFIRTSMSDYRKQDWLINLPFYATSELKVFLQ
jgi:hypothetical protein